MTDIVFTKPAEYDLLDIEYYIFVEFCDSQAAQRISDGILNTIECIRRYPNKWPTVRDEILERINLKKAVFDNYNIFYYFDKRADRIYIVRILHHRLDWKRFL